MSTILCVFSQECVGSSLKPGSEGRERKAVRGLMEGLDVALSLPPGLWASKEEKGQSLICVSLAEVGTQSVFSISHHPGTISLLWGCVPKQHMLYIQ